MQSFEGRYQRMTDSPAIFQTCRDAKFGATLIIDMGYGAHTVIRLDDSVSRRLGEALISIARPDDAATPHSDRER